MLRRTLRTMNGILVNAHSSIGHSIDNKSLKFYKPIIQLLPKTIKHSTNIKSRFIEICFRDFYQRTYSTNGCLNLTQWCIKVEFNGQVNLLKEHFAQINKWYHLQDHQLLLVVIIIWAAAIIHSAVVLQPQPKIREICTWAAIHRY